LAQKVGQHRLSVLLNYDFQAIVLFISLFYHFQQQKQHIKKDNFVLALMEKMI